MMRRLTPILCFRYAQNLAGVHHGASRLFVERDNRRRHEAAYRYPGGGRLKGLNEVATVSFMSSETSVNGTDSRHGFHRSRFSSLKPFEKIHSGSDNLLLYILKSSSQIRFQHMKSECMFLQGCVHTDRLLEFSRSQLYVNQRPQSMYVGTFPEYHLSKPSLTVHSLSLYRTQFIHPI